MPIPFMGETMICRGCGKVEKSDPNVESNWTCTIITTTDGRRIRRYFCPECFGNDQYLRSTKK